MLKPSDLFVLLKIAAVQASTARAPVAQAPTYAELAGALGMSASQVYRAVQHCQTSHLLRGRDSVDRKSLLGVLVHAARHLYPAEAGAVTRGMPTAHAAPPLSRELSSTGLGVVWPDPQGSARGEALAPLDKRAPGAAAKDEHFYELLTLTDALRVGRARERARAAELLEERLL